MIIYSFNYEIGIIYENKLNVLHLFVFIFYTIAENQIKSYDSINFKFMFEMKRSLCLNVVIDPALEVKENEMKKKSNLLVRLQL